MNEHPHRDAARDRPDDGRGSALGLEADVVRLAEPDTRWPDLFLEESARVLAAIAGSGLPPLVLEHVGSTAVQGLPAKPILDLAAARPADVPADRYFGVLEESGYLARGECGLPDRHFFTRGDPRSYHLHLVSRSSRYWSDYLAFREALRADRSLARRYAARKAQLASRHPRDREAYTEGKSEFVQEVLRRSRNRSKGG